MTTAVKKRFTLFGKKQTETAPVDEKPATPEKTDAVVETVVVEEAAEKLVAEAEAVAIEAPAETEAPAAEKTAGLFGTLFKRKAAKKVCFFFLTP
jgi:hypothetical protein